MSQFREKTYEQTKDGQKDQWTEPILLDASGRGPKLFLNKRFWRATKTNPPKNIYIQKNLILYKVVKQ